MISANYVRKNTRGAAALYPPSCICGEKELARDMNIDLLILIVTV